MGEQGHPATAARPPGVNPSVGTGLEFEVEGTLSTSPHTRLQTELKGLGPDLEPMHEVSTCSNPPVGLDEPMHISDPMHALGSNGMLDANAIAQVVEVTNIVAKGRGKCSVFGHMEDVNKPPPLHLVAETLDLGSVKMVPPLATYKGKKVMDDGFIEVTWK
ncbi:hypothetical protein L1987_30951 [Smallanthus sonchifolius]|uniref:Uncharacterized protein n=1 Tax=Smallanthus sonchifolius TaxID=185202 RepID=A0ACB9I3K2_9ASTR|nr:hypothetical protein L1987_30951 [Smallanthus sonchifolius]